MVPKVLYEVVVPLAPTLLLSNRGERVGRQIIVCGVVGCGGLAGCCWSSGSTTCSNGNGTGPWKTEFVELLELLLRQVTLVPSVSLSLYPTVQLFIASTFRPFLMFVQVFHEAVEVF